MIPTETVRRVLFAVDPTTAVVDEVLETGADLLVTHHPLLLTPVHGVPADDPKGRLVHRLIRGGAALFVAHTNADRAPDAGVNDALAAASGCATPCRWSRPPSDPRAGLGRVGRAGRGGDACASSPSGWPAVLPATAGGVRAAGDPDRPVRTVAVCGGSGGSLVGAAAAAGADVLLTSDLKHHPVSEALESNGPALCDVAHFASEWPWLPVAADVLRRDLSGAGGGGRLAAPHRPVDVARGSARGSGRAIGRLTPGARPGERGAHGLRNSPTAESTGRRTTSRRTAATAARGTGCCWWRSWCR